MDSVDITKQPAFLDQQQQLDRVTKDLHNRRLRDAQRRVKDLISKGITKPVLDKVVGDFKMEFDAEATYDGTWESNLTSIEHGLEILEALPQDAGVPTGELEGLSINEEKVEEEQKKFDKEINDTVNAVAPQYNRDNIYMDDRTGHFLTKVQ